MPGRNVGNVLLLVGVELGEDSGEDLGVIGKEREVSVAGELSTVQGLGQDRNEGFEVGLLRYGDMVSFVLGEQGGERGGERGREERETERGERERELNVPNISLAASSRT